LIDRIREDLPIRELVLALIDHPGARETADVMMSTRHDGTFRDFNF
jgi:hypothetical protein